MIFPPMAISIVIMLNGSPLRSYNPPYLIHGRIEAPVAPFLTRIADRIGYAGETMIIVRGNASVRILTGRHDPKSLQAVYVPIAGVLRALGTRVNYDPSRRVLDIQTGGKRPVQTMQPYQVASPLPAPTTVFTPEPVQTPRPVYTGSPHPRRTPIVRSTSRP
ncbi:MAG: hypothetical protein ABR584_01985 [Candidatus Baltobacteraceae bacterium]